MKTNVAIIGGGIGGMEAAILCAKRGHSVTLYEKTDKLGGVFIAAAAPSYKEKDKMLITWYEREIRKYPIEIKLNTEVKSLDKLKNADEVIVATGAKARKLPIPGVEKALEAVDFLLGDKERIGENVVVIGGGLTGCEIAYELYLDGKKPVIVEAKHDLIVADGVCLANSSYLRDFFNANKVPAHLETSVKEIKDGRVISLIHKYLNAGVLVNGMFERTEIGMPQGGPLSPLLSNIMLNEMDKELERRGHRFVRYADDCMIFCKSRKSAQRTLENIIPFIERKLFLKVNRNKTGVAHISKVKYLGYSFYRYKGKCRFRVHPKSVTKMRNKIRELTDRNNGMSNTTREEKYQQYVTGWVNYFKLADMKKLLKETDEWARRRIRAVYWKQWKKIKTKYRMLKALGMEHWKAKELACSRKGYWRMARVLNQIFSNKIIVKLGYTSMIDHYLIVYEN